MPALDFIRYAETAAAFDDLTRNGRLREVESGPEKSRRPAEIRPARFIPAVEYIQANRYRMRVMEQVDAAMSELDLFIGADLLLTNRTGHPVISLPSGFFEGVPTGLQLTRQAVLASRSYCCWPTRSSPRQSSLETPDSLGARALFAERRLGNGHQSSSAPQAPASRRATSRISRRISTWDDDRAAAGRPGAATTGPCRSSPRPEDRDRLTRSRIRSRTA